MSYDDVGPVPRRCPCGCYPEVVEFTGAPVGNRVQVGCDCCGRCTFRHEEASPMSARSRAINVWNELVSQADGGAPWPEPRGPWRYRSKFNERPCEWNAARGEAGKEEEE